MLVFWENVTFLSFGGVNCGVFEAASAVKRRLRLCARDCRFLCDCTAGVIGVLRWSVLSFFGFHVALCS